MKSCKDFRAEGREILGNTLFQRRWLFPLIACAIITGISTVATEFFLLSFIITGALGVGLSTYFLKLVRERDGEEKNLRPLFVGFTNNFGRNLGVGLYLSILNFIYIFLIVAMIVASIYLWVLVFILPLPIYGLIRVNLKYAMVYYIIADNPEYGVWQSLRESAIMMRGYKLKYFRLQLSFIGWIILCSFTFGVGSLWLTPYMHATNTVFYEQLKQENEYYVL